MIKQPSKNVPAPKAPEPAKVETTVAFGVVYYPQSKMYVPMRFEVTGDKVTDSKQIAPAGPYKPVAYQYLAGAVMEFYNSVQLKEAHALSKAGK